MATAAAALPLLQRRERVHAKPRPRARFPIENTLLFGVAVTFYIIIANYIVFHVHYMINDAYARIDNAFDVLFTRDPHLAAIGFVWPPLPSFVDLPIIAFRGVWPALVNQGFGGSIEAAIFSAGTVVLFNVGLRWAGVVRGMRWIFCLAWLFNPMIIIYAVQGMAEAMFVFFAVASILVFLRWCENRRGGLLPLMGILAGLGCLCRNEMFFLTAALGAGVVIRTIRWKVSWREVETVALMFALPALLMIMLWIGSMAIILRDPLYWIHAQNGAIGGKIAAGGGGGGGVSVDTWRSAFDFVIGHSLLLFPAIIAALGILVARVLVKKDRVTGLILISFAFPIALIDIYLLHNSGLAPNLRYQIFVIPYTFVVFVYVLRSLRTKRAVLQSLIALPMVAVLGLSNIATAETLGNPLVSQEEAPLITAIASGQTMEQLGRTNSIDFGMQVAPLVEALDTDHGLIACDSTTCFPVILNVKHPDRFVVTSDRDFQAVIAQPQVYHVEYFLVLDPAQGGSRDELNIIYPGLYEDGGGFSIRVGDAGPFRLYRVVGPTGRG